MEAVISVIDVIKLFGRKSRFPTNKAVEKVCYGDFTRSKNVGHCYFNSNHFVSISVAASQVAQILDGEQETSGVAREKRHESLPGFDRQRGVLVLHISLLQAQVERGQRRGGRQSEFSLFCLYSKLFLKPHSHPNGFYWGHQCSWTLPQPTACRYPSCSLTTATGSNQAQSKVQTYLAREVWGGWGEHIVNLVLQPTLSNTIRS